MPFDPNIPSFKAPNSSEQMRAQLNALKQLIDAIPAGPPGPAGPEGPPLAALVVDSVTTLPAGSPASVTATFDGTTVHLAFALPQGDPGPTGPSGSDGAPGEVSTAAMNTAIDAAIAGTARNITGIPTFAGGFSNPPTQQEMQDFATYVESLRQALVRT